MSGLSGTGALLRLYLRRDRLVAPIWVVLLGALPLLYAVSFEGCIRRRQTGKRSISAPRQCRHKQRSSDRSSAATSVPWWRGAPA